MGTSVASVEGVVVWAHETRARCDYDRANSRHNWQIVLITSQIDGLQLATFHIYSNHPRDLLKVFFKVLAESSRFSSLHQLCHFAEEAGLAG